MIGEIWNPQDNIANDPYSIHPYVSTALPTNSGYWLDPLSLEIHTEIQQLELTEAESAILDSMGTWALEAYRVGLRSENSLLVPLANDPEQQANILHDVGLSATGQFTLEDFASKYGEDINPVEIYAAYYLGFWGISDIQTTERMILTASKAQIIEDREEFERHCQPHTAACFTGSTVYTHGNDLDFEAHEFTHALFDLSSFQSTLEVPLESDSSGDESGLIVANLGRPYVRVEDSVALLTNYHEGLAAMFELTTINSLIYNPNLSGISGYLSGSEDLNLIASMCLHLSSISTLETRQNISQARINGDLVSLMRIFGRIVNEIDPDFVTRIGSSQAVAEGSDNVAQLVATTTSRSILDISQKITDDNLQTGVVFFTEIGLTASLVNYGILGSLSIPVVDNSETGSVLWLEVGHPVEGNQPETNLAHFRPDQSLAYLARSSLQGNHALDELLVGHERETIMTIISDSWQQVFGNTDRLNEVLAIAASLDYSEYNIGTPNAGFADGSEWINNALSDVFTLALREGLGSLDNPEIDYGQLPDPENERGGYLTFTHTSLDERTDFTNPLSSIVFLRYDQEGLVDQSTVNATSLPATLPNLLSNILVSAFTGETRFLPFSIGGFNEQYQTLVGYLAGTAETTADDQLRLSANNNLINGLLGGNIFTSVTSLMQTANRSGLHLASGSDGTPPELPEQYQWIINLIHFGSRVPTEYGTQSLPYIDFSIPESDTTLLDSASRIINSGLTEEEASLFIESLNADLYR